ncbi:MAG TPA: class I SAM-dependent methyltransferase [Gemmatimonadaceae bacterium]|jgi:ubiquinone/menaquinone biosynthesis C-methylase UbiE
MSPQSLAHENLDVVVDIIGRQNPLQKKRIRAFLSTRDDTYWDFAEALSATLVSRLMATAADAEATALAYNRMCMDFVKEQIRFKKTGSYLIQDASVANEQVYSRPEVMRNYMVSLLLTYMFWPNQYAMLQFLDDYWQSRPVRRYLDIAPGHGLFTVKAVQRWPDLDATVIDISETSLRVAREILEAFEIDTSKIEFVHGDFLKTELPGGGFDFITMGEVLEHVNDAPEFLVRARELLNPGGALYMTTCANCPAVDHVYHFHTVREIRDLIGGAGLQIVDEVALPAEPFPEDRWEAELVTINYAAILKRA